MKYFCSLPWTGLDIDPQGNFRPCCKYNASTSGSINDYLHSAELIKLKEQFQSGEQPVGCSRCWIDENAGLPSKRQLDLKYKFNNKQPLLDTFKLLSLPFGNTCNLACRTCSSHSSSKWGPIEKSMPLLYTKVYSHKKFYRDVDFINKLKLHTSQLIDIEFPGGEPFITGVNEQLDFLDHLISLNRSNDISLTYITNCTMFPDKEFLDRWEKFKKVTILMSIDGIANKFEYLRWPANWEMCLENIKQYQHEQKIKNNINLSISHTVSIFNVLDLPQFLIWCYKQGLPFPYIGMVQDPLHFNIQYLPSSIKEKITQKLSNTSKLLPVTEYMNSVTSSKEYDLKSIIDPHDTYRKQNFYSTFPELAKIIFQ